MISRGEVGLIVTAMGASTGIFGRSDVAVMVAVVLLTTLVTPLALRATFQLKSDEDLEDEAGLLEAGFTQFEEPLSSPSRPTGCEKSRPRKICPKELATPSMSVRERLSLLFQQRIRFPTKPPTSLDDSFTSFCCSTPRPGLPLSSRRTSVSISSLSLLASTASVSPRA